MTIFQKSWLTKNKNYIYIGLLVLLTLKVIIPQLDGLYDSLAALKDANLYWIALGTLVFFSGVTVLALQFMALALKPLKFGLTYKVQMAGLFVSKLLPSALGSISLNMYYFVQKGHTLSQATTVITMNGLTSGIAYCFLILLSLTQSSLSLEGLAGEVHIPTNLILFVLILLIGISYLVYRSGKIRATVKSTLSDLKKNFAIYKQRPQSLLYGLVCNFTGSFTSLFALYASAHAIGAELSLAGALLAYTFGNVAATLVPTPGGVGSTEAGIYSGLVLVGLAGPSAMVVTLLYRLITYWLPIIPGYYFFQDLRKTILSSFSIKNKKQSAA